LGAEVSIGHADHDDVDTVVYSTAIPMSHLELRTAAERGLPTFRRAAALSAAVADRPNIAVSGTHGKTTTTSLATVAAQACGLDPSFAIGGNLYESGRNAHFGSGKYAFVEADESDGSFLLLRPRIAVVTNVEADHLENYGDLEAIFWASLAVRRPDLGGLLVACADDPGPPGGRLRVARAVGADLGGRRADVRVENVVSTWLGPSIRHRAVRQPDVVLGALIGRHGRTAPPRSPWP
jgi:UDP-N-acetylmuramate--alanine ligase